MNDDTEQNVEPSKYRDKLTERFASGKWVRQFQGFKDQAERRPDLLETVVSLDDLKKLPSNRFEALGGDRKGQFSIRINDQWRICFEWPVDAIRPFNIEIVDYHWGVRLWRAIRSIPANF
ncbi:MAG: type II toxin-antitoxin system RelE/ParE family toxin [Magnetococcales bacterium]|nr:type II toxin-antitoxin system RelE/ParE family toxin [Magnetococcales bacterium]